MLIGRFLAYLPRPNGSEGPFQGGVVKEYAHRKGYRVVEDGYVLAFLPHGGTGAPGDASPVRGGAGAASIGGGGGVSEAALVHVQRGVRASRVGRELETCLAAAAGGGHGATGLGAPPPALGQTLRERAHLHNLILRTPGRMRISSDLLGLLPYYAAELSGGLLVSSSVSDLFGCFPELVRPVDPVGMAEYLAGSYCRGRRTCHGRVRSSGAGEVLLWERSTGAAVLEQAYEAPEVEGGSTLEALVEGIVGAMRHAVAAFLGGDEEPVVPLTGGFDSRLIASCLRGLGVDFQAVTMGLRHHEEVRVARRVAQVLGVDHRVLRPKGDLLDRLDLWLDTLEGQAGYGTLYITHLLDGGFPSGTTLLHGLLGGPVAGSPTEWLKKDEPANLESFRRAVYERSFGALQEGFLEALNLDMTVASLAETLVPVLPEAPHPHQGMVLWDLHQRQRRGMATQVHYLGAEYRVGVPFSVRAVLDACLRVPRAATGKRVLPAKWCEAAWPPLATLPHCEEEPSVIPSRDPRILSYVLHRYWDRARYGVARRAMPWLRLREDKGYIWGFWFGGTDEQRRRLTSALGQGGEVVAEVLGWDPRHSAGPEFWTRLARTDRQSDQMLRSYYLLTEYCRWLKRTVPGV